MQPWTHDNPDYRQLVSMPDSYSRRDETEDAAFYSRDRFVQHLDVSALETVENVIGQLVVEEQPAVLDLMAGTDSHIPETMQLSKLTGLGLNASELQANGRLDERILHDLNRDPVLPLPDQSFDVVLNVVSVQYLVHPVQIFREVGRVLRPGGLCLVVFSNRMFPPKVVKLWELLTEHERIRLVSDYFEKAGEFEAPQVFLSMGRPRPKTDKYADSGLLSDPVFAVYADRVGSPADRPKRPRPVDPTEEIDPSELERRKAKVKENLTCPYCEEKLRIWAVTENPMSTWDHDLYVCANDACPYLTSGWKAMFLQGNTGVSYRLCYDPQSDTFKPIPAMKSSLGD